MAILKALKKLLDKQYKIKDLREIKTIIGWQITKDPVVRTMKINQSVFIRDLVIKEELTDCNVNVILIKAGSTIEITGLKDYKETELCEYQYLISKFMYLACETRSDIAFVVG